MRSADAAVALARRATVRIPSAQQGTLRLADDYQASPLARFHRTYYECCEEPKEEDVRPVLPPCAARVLENPHCALLQPAGIQHIVRVLMALGWPPRPIARLIQSKFEEDHGWGERWSFYNPAVRADFYTRLFAGMVACGQDGLADFNSVSHIEKEYCSDAVCGCDLRVYRRSLEERKDHERLGGRPFNRLFSA